MPIEDLISPRYRDFLVSAAADPEAWRLALGDVAQKTGSVGAILFHRTAMPGTPVSDGVAEGMDTYWRDSWIERDVRMRAIPVQAALGLGTDEDCVSVDEMRRAPLYNEFLARFGLKWFGGVGFTVAGAMWCLSIQRSPGQGQFDAGERKVLRAMSRMMGDVGELNHLIAEAKTSGLQTALDRMGDGWITFDARGRRIAEGPAVMAEGGDLKRLAVVQRAVAAALRQAMHPDPAVHGAPVVVAELGPKLPVTVRALRLCEIHAGFGRAQYLVVVRAPPRPALPDAAALAARFGLTPAEARLARLLGQGRTLKAAAEEAEISYETARTQLKAVFAKCGVNRQAELAIRLHAG